MFRIVICDDEEAQLRQLYKICRTVCEKHHFQADIVCYAHSETLFYDIQEGQNYDLILTDIEMPRMDGMRLAKEIRTFLPDVLVIFITAYVKYAVDAYELSVFRYIPKAELAERMERAVVDAFHMLMIQEEKFYFIQTTLKSEKIPLKQIVYIQKDRKNALISCRDGMVYSVRKSLNTVMAEIDSDDFVFADRGIILNLPQIIRIQGDDIELSNKVRIRAAHARMEEIKRKLAEFWKGHAG